MAKENGVKHTFDSRQFGRRMEKFDSIHQRALDRKGGPKALAAFLPKVKTPAAVKKIADDRFLSEMSRCVFQAGFVWRVVDKKWDDFERVFFKFAPHKIVLLSPEQIEAIGQNPAIIRNMQKIISVQNNAQYIVDTAHKHGSFANMVAEWPAGDHIGLYRALKQGGSRLGGATGPRSLRNLGIDTFVLSSDVVHCLIHAGVDIAKNPTSQKDMRAIQSAFNEWHEQSGLPYTHLSRVAACSVGENYDIEVFTR